MRSFWGLALASATFSDSVDRPRKENFARDAALTEFYEENKRDVNEGKTRRLNKITLDRMKKKHEMFFIGTS